MFTDDAKAVIALTTRLGSSRRPSLSPVGWHRLESGLGEHGLRPVDLFETTRSVRDMPGLPGELVDAVESLLADAGAATTEAVRLSGRGIWVLTIADLDYPPQLRRRLGLSAPPVLFGVGERGLLGISGFGVVGSREVDEAGAGVAEAAADRAARMGRPVVSGGARGVDRLAMDAAHRAGGPVVGVLADSLVARIRGSETLTALDEHPICLVTQQSPSSGFTAAAAMARNKIVYGLSTVTLVVACAEGSGGTWAGATEALRTGNGTIAIWRGAGEASGNEALERRGAVAVTDLEQIDVLLAVPAASSEPEPPQPVQLGLL
ncbi:MAG: DNA-processing protein DprA [Acidimicrobiia bacterium]